jgi:hypothetical protein
MALSYRFRDVYVIYLDGTEYEGIGLLVAPRVVDRPNPDNDDKVGPCVEWLTGVGMGGHQLWVEVIEEGEEGDGSLLRDVSDPDYVWRTKVLTDEMWHELVALKKMSYPPGADKDMPVGMYKNVLFSDLIGDWWTEKPES